MKIGLIGSHGGHLTEMLELLPAFDGHDLFFVTYQSARADELAASYRVYPLRYIGTNPLLLLATLPVAWHILRHEQPNVVVSTGAEIALPFFLLAKAFPTRTIFVESCCLVKTRSKTGRLLYPLADAFLVQWPQLTDLYGPKAIYAGGLL